MSTNDIGYRVFMATVHPATNTEPGFDALTWVAVDGIQSIGERGISHSGIDVPDLQSGFTPQVKGAGAGRDTVLTFRTIQGNAAQASLKTAADSPAGIISLKIIKASGVAGAPVIGDPVEYAQGIVHSYTARERSTSSHGGFSVTFRNNAPWVEALEDA
jgi:hypothetical protein